MLKGTRRILVIVVTLIAIPIVTPIATAAASSAVVALPSVDQPPLAKRGDRSSTVKRLQQMLVRASIPVAGGTDGIFGPGTEAAVRQYQTQRGLTVNGVLDVPTATVLGMVEATPILNRGSRGEAVRVVQQQLITVGLSLTGGADGVYGSATVATVRGFQRAKDLPASGAVDAGTAAILANAAAAFHPAPPPTPAPPPPTTPPPTTAPPPPTTEPNVVLLKVGNRGEAVKLMQGHLMFVGIAVFGGADGVFGPATQSSLKKFQANVGLPTSGVFDTATKAALANAVGMPPPTTPPAPPPPTTEPNVVLLKVGNRGEAVKLMQGHLMFVGIAVFGGADGVFGPATQSSLKKFQANVGLPTSGVFDTATQAALANAVGMPPPSTPTTPPPPPTTPPPTTVPEQPAVVLTSFPVAATCAFWDTFGAPRSGGRKHEGVDIMVAEGTPIYAVADGTITRKQLTYVGSLGGNALWLTAPDKSYFYYAHLSAFAPGIEAGTVVTSGMLIGYVGATGNASVPHLHFEVHPFGGKAVDPFPIVKAASNCK